MEVDRMLKYISLKKIINTKKLSCHKNENIYDKTWKMTFGNAEKRLKFLNRIASAEKSINEGEYYTQKEMEELLAKEYGIFSKSI